MQRRIDLGRVDLGMGKVGRFTIPAPGHGLVHVLCSGKTRSGKSVTTAKAIGEMAASPIISFVGIDLKGGMDLSPWRARFTELAFNIPDAEELLRCVRQLIEERAVFVTEVSRVEGRTIRKWEDRFGPTVVLVIDEMAELTRSQGDKKNGVFPALEELSSIAARGAAVNVHVWACTQYALKKLMGSSLLTNLEGRIAHRMATDVEYAVALGLSATEFRSMTEWFEPITAEVEQRGVFYAAGFDDPDLNFRRARSSFISDEKIDVHAPATAHLRWAPEDVFGLPPVEWVVAQNRNAG